MSVVESDTAAWVEIPGIVVPADIAAVIVKWQQYRLSLPVSASGQLSLWHSTCTHRNYNLTCEQYEQLLIDSRFACQCCKATVDKLVIDHDHAVGFWGVRGLLCPPCNARLGGMESGRVRMDDRTRAFLAAPYDDRNPPVVVPVKPLRSLLVAEYQTACNVAARAAGFRLSSISLRDAAVIRRTEAYKRWRNQWLRESGYDRYTRLIHQIDDIQAAARLALVDTEGGVVAADAAPQHDAGMAALDGS